MYDHVRLRDLPRDIKIALALGCLIDLLVLTACAVPLVLAAWVLCGN